MRKNWQNVVVDLNSLASSIQGFFDDRGFLTTVNGSSSCGFVVRAEASDVYDVDGGVIVTLNGSSNGVAISFDFERERSRVNFSPLAMSFFGAGVFFVRRVRCDENRVRLEREFWRFIDGLLSCALMKP
jgi:hypothetical protein